MTNILIEPKNSPYTYIYVSREYYDGKCLNENRLGIGKSKDPYKRLKDHNSSSSKISVEVKFELLYKTKEQDTFFHNLLKNKGYKQIKKEIFEGTENRPLTLTEVKSLIESYSIDGPWIFKNNQFIKLKSNNQFNEYQIKMTLENDLWEQHLLNKFGSKEFKSPPKDNIQTQIKNDDRPNIKNTTPNSKNLKTQNTKPKSLDEKWEDDLFQFHFESWLVGLPAQLIFQIIMANNKRFQNDKIGFLILDFGIILLHVLLQCLCYHSFKNNWIQKNNK